MIYNYIQHRIRDFEKGGTIGICPFIDKLADIFLPNKNTDMYV